MPDSFLNKMELEARISSMKDRELLELCAREISAVGLLVQDHNKRIKRLESRSKKEIGASGGIGAAIGTGIGYLIQFFTGR